MSGLLLAFLISVHLIPIGTDKSSAQVRVDASDENSRGTHSVLTKCWDRDLEDGAGSVVAGAKGLLLISEVEGRLRAINADSGEVLWVTELGGQIDGISISTESMIFVLTSSNHTSGTASSTLRRLDLDTGLVKFSVPIDATSKVFLKSTPENVIVIGPAGTIEAFEAETGRSAWKTAVRGRISSVPAINESTIAISTDSKTIELLSANDGTIITSIGTEREIKTLGFRSNQMLLAGDDRGNITNFRAKTGTIWWRFKSGGRIGTIHETKQGIVVGSYDNFVYLLSNNSGSVIWKRRLAGRVDFRPVILDNLAIFCVSGEDDLKILDLEKGRIVEQS